MKFSIKRFAATFAALTLIGSSVTAMTASAYTYNTDSSVTFTSMTQDKAPKCMADFMNAECKKFPNGKYWSNNMNYTNDKAWNNANRYKKAYSDTINDSADNSFTVDDIVGSDYKYLVNSGKNNNQSNYDTYYECYGFALKLASDYFDTKSFIRLDGVNFNSATYKPRVGDVIRIGKNGAGFHSIFVTKVEGNIITFADCNSDKHNLIRWSQKIDIKNFNICGYNEIEWVERPMMVGDVNGDTVVDITDVSTLSVMVNATKDNTKSGVVTIYRNKAADLNKDGKVNSKDLDLLRSYVISGKGSYAYVKTTRMISI